MFVLFYLNLEHIYNIAKNKIKIKINAHNYFKK